MQRDRVVLFDLVVVEDELLELCHSFERVTWDRVEIIVGDVGLQKIFSRSFHSISTLIVIFFETLER